MESLLTGKTIAVAAALAFLAGCGSSGGVPSAASGVAGSAGHIGSNAASSNFSGQYTGKFKDIAYGTGKATASYAQAQNGLGGVLTIKYAHTTIAASVALIANSSGVNGTSVAGTGSLYCTISTNGTYDPKTHTLSGTYKAVYGCKGDSGTFSLKHECYYKGTGTEDVRPEAGPKPC